jgi:hypothetical protein
MAVIDVPVGPPYGTIPVNTGAIYAVVPHPADPAAASDLLIDSSGARSIQALLPITNFGGVLGKDFAEFPMADIAQSTCFVNRMTWVSIVPHPQIAGVVQINFAHHYIPVRGTVEGVKKQLLPAALAAVRGMAGRRARPKGRPS